MLNPIARIRQIDDEMELYRGGVKVVGWPVFVLAWLYAVTQYGFFLGVGLGWIPAAVIGLVVGALWPVLLIAVPVLFALAGRGILSF